MDLETRFSLKKANWFLLMIGNVRRWYRNREVIREHYRFVHTGTTVVTKLIVGYRIFYNLYENGAGERKLVINCANTKILEKFKFGTFDYNSWLLPWLDHKFSTKQIRDAERAAQNSE